MNAPHPVRSFRPLSLAFLLTTITVWGVNPLFARYQAGYYDVWTQNAYRYAVAAAALLALRAVLRRRALRPPRPLAWGRLVVVVTVNICMQTCFAATYYFLYPSVASLVGRTSIIMSILVSFVVFHDERAVIRSRAFLFGAGLSLAGVVAVVAGRDVEALEALQAGGRTFWIGIGIVLAYAFFTAAYAAAIKSAVREVDPLWAFTHVAWMTAIGLNLLMFLLGRPADLWRQPAMPLGIMTVSALGAIALAHSTYYAALREIHAVIAVSLMQILPVITCSASALWYRDRLTAVQIVGGCAAVVGGWLAAMAQVRLAHRHRAVLRPPAS